MVRTLLPPSALLFLVRLLRPLPRTNSLVISLPTTDTTRSLTRKRWPQWRQSYQPSCNHQRRPSDPAVAPPLGEDIFSALCEHSPAVAERLYRFLVFVVHIYTWPCAKQEAQRPAAPPRTFRDGRRDPTTCDAPTGRGVRTAG